MNGRTFVKELGKTTRRKFATCLSSFAFRFEKLRTDFDLERSCPSIAQAERKAKEDAAKDFKQLFIKNIGLCKPVRGSIGADA